MKKPIPRKWYSLEVAAKRLSVFFNDDVTIKDILELALENEIRICWDMRGHYLQPEKINDLPAGEVFEAFGYYELSISEYPWNNEWLKELIRETPSNEFATSKLLVKDRHGNNFTIVSPVWIKTDSGRNVQYVGGDFHPSIVDIFIYSKDLEEFEEKYTEDTQESDISPPAPRTKSSSAMLDSLGIMALLVYDHYKDEKKISLKDEIGVEKIVKFIRTEVSIRLKSNEKNEDGLSNLTKDIREALKHIKPRWKS